MFLWCFKVISQLYHVYPIPIWFSAKQKKSHNIWNNLLKTQKSKCIHDVSVSFFPQLLLSVLEKYSIMQRYCHVFTGLLLFSVAPFSIIHHLCPFVYWPYSDILHTITVHKFGVDANSDEWKEFNFYFALLFTLFALITQMVLLE